MKRVAFEALIKSVSVKSLVSGDMEAQMTLRFAPTEETMDGLTRLQRADRQVMVALVEITDNAKNRHENASGETLQEG